MNEAFKSELTRLVGQRLIINELEFGWRLNFKPADVKEFSAISYQLSMVSSDCIDCRQLGKFETKTRIIPIRHIAVIEY